MKHKTVLHPVRLVACIVLLVAAQFSAEAKDEATSKISTKVAAFIENKGQVTDQFGKQRKDIDFVVKGNGFSLFAGDAKLHYQFTKSASEKTIDQDVLTGFKRMSAKDNEKFETYRMDITLVNANVNAKIIKEEALNYFERYYYPSLGEQGAKANGFKKITYKNIYPNIDWVLYINDASQQGVKYDFIIRQGGNPADIQLKYDGETSLQMKDGALVAATPLGVVTEQKPYSYDAMTKKEVVSSYVLNEDVLSFNVAPHDGVVVIDPTIDWSTYFGGSSLEYGYTVATDTGGSSYMAGHTSSSSGIATSGAFSTTYNGNNDAYLVKFDKYGSLQWATYYGGSASDNFFYVATDSLGNIYASGVTASSSGITTTGAYQTTYGGGVSDAYLVKFATANGSRIWATYFGGSGDEAVAASFDDYMVSTAWSRATNHVYLCGMTTSTTGISTSGSFQSSLAGGTDGYIAQFTSNGALQWATYYGGNADDKIIKMACNDSGHVYATGPTTSTSGIATSGVYQTSNAGSVDAMIVKFESSGLRMWATYFGGTNADEPAGIAVDNTGAIYIAGSTTSLSGIATVGSFQQTIAGSGPTDAYLEKFAPDGSRIWGTYFGGPGPDHTADIAIDATGNVCFSGFTGSSSGITTLGTYQYNFGGNSDGFIAIFGPTGTRSWVSYLGGIDADNSSGISYSRTGDLFITGHTNSSSGIASTGAHQTTINGSEDAYIAKFKADTSAFVLPTFSPLVYCSGDSMYVPFGITNPFLSGNVFTVELSNPAGGFATPTTIGTLATTNPGVIGCKLPSTLSTGANYRIRITYTNPGGAGYPNTNSINIKLLPEKPVATSNGPVCSQNDLIISGTSSTSGVTYQWTGPNLYTSTKQIDTFFTAPTHFSGDYVITAVLAGCYTKDTITAAVDSTPEVPVVASNSPVCMTDTIALAAGSGTLGVNYTWVGPAGFSSSSQNPNILSASTAKAGYYVGTAHLGNCSTKDSTLVSVVNILTPSVSLAISPGTQICIGDLVSFTATSANGGSNPAYKWYVNGVQVAGVNTWYWSSSTLMTGDVVHCVFVGDWPCLTKPADTSNKFTINASGNVPPAVNIRATPSLSVPLGTAITFAATPVNGGNFPNYRWVKNGATVKYGKSNIYIATTGKDIKAGDKIEAILVSDLVCANPDSAYSNTLTIGEPIILTGVGNTINGKPVQIYPNPAKDQLIVEGLDKGIAVQLTDVLGKVVFNAISNGVKDVLNISALATGTYVLHLRDDEGNHSVSKVVVSR